MKSLAFILLTVCYKANKRENTMIKESISDTTLYSLKLNVDTVIINNTPENDQCKECTLFSIRHQEKEYQRRNKIKLKNLNIHSMEYGWANILINVVGEEKMIGKIYFREFQMTSDKFILVDLYKVDTGDKDSFTMIGYAKISFKIKNIMKKEEVLLKKKLKKKGLGFINLEHILLKPRLSTKMIMDTLENKINKVEPITNIKIQLRNLLTLNSKMINRCDGRCETLSCSLYCKNGYNVFDSKTSKKLLGLLKMVFLVKYYTKSHKSSSQEIDENVDILAKGPTSNGYSFLLYKKTEDEVVLAFGGIDNVDDFTEFLDLRITQFYKTICQQGIKTLFVTFIEENWALLREIIGKYKKLTITGHSIGGGIATMLHYYLHETKILANVDVNTVTFGSPPVFYNIKKAKHYPNIKNYIFGSDPIPSLCFGQILLLKMALDKISSKKDSNMHNQTLTDMVEEKSFMDLLHGIYCTIQKYNFVTLDHLGHVYRIMDFRDESKLTTSYYCRRSTIPYYLAFTRWDSLEYHFIFNYLQALSRTPNRAIISDNCHNHVVFSLCQALNKIVEINDSVFNK